MDRHKHVYPHIYKHVYQICPGKVVWLFETEPTSLKVLFIYQILGVYVLIVSEVNPFDILGFTHPQEKVWLVTQLFGENHS